MSKILNEKYPHKSSHESINSNDISLKVKLEKIEKENLEIICLYDNAKKQYDNEKIEKMLLEKKQNECKNEINFLSEELKDIKSNHEKSIYREKVLNDILNEKEELIKNFINEQKNYTCKTNEYMLNLNTLNLVKELKEKENSLNIFKEKYENQIKKCLELESKYENIKTICNIKEEKLKEFNEHIKTLSEKNISLLNENKSLTSDINNISIKNSSINEKFNEFTREIENKDKCIYDSKKEMIMLKNKIESVTLKMENLKNLNNDYSYKLQEKDKIIKESNDRLTIIENSYNCIKEEHNILNRKHNEISTNFYILQNEKSLLIKQINSLSEIKSTLNSDNKPIDNSKSLNIIHKYESIIKSLNDEIKNLIEEKTNLNERLNNLKINSESIKENINYIYMKDNKFDSLKIEYSELYKKYTVQTLIIDNLNSEMLKIKENNNSFNSQNHHFHDKIYILENTNKQLEQNIFELNKQLFKNKLLADDEKEKNMQIIEENSNLNTKVKEISNKSIQKEDFSNKIKQIIKSKDEIIYKLNIEINHMNMNLDNKNKIISNLQSQIEELKLQYSNLDNKNKQLNALFIKYKLNN